MSNIPGNISSNKLTHGVKPESSVSLSIFTQNHASVSATGPPGGAAATTSEFPDILDVNALSTYIIPKKKRKTSQLLEKLNTNDVHERDVKSLIKKSFRSPESEANWSYSHVYIVNNDKLLAKFSEKKKEMKKNNYSDKEVQDSYAFLYFPNYAKASKACEEGMHINNSDSVNIGNPKMGVYLCRNADVPLPEVPRTMTDGRLVVFKIMKGKVKSMVDCHEGPGLDPTPGFDSHVSKCWLTPVQQLTLKEAYDSGQIYLYEYDDTFEAIDRPRHIVPYAVVTTRYLGKVMPFKKKRPSESDTKTAHVSTPKTLTGLAGKEGVPSLLSLKIPPPVSSVPHSLSPTLQRVVGCLTPDGATVVWAGGLAHKDTLLCSVQLQSYAKYPVQPALIGSYLKLSKGLKWSTLANMLKDLGSIDKQLEMQCGGTFLTYCKLVAMEENLTAIQPLTDHLRTQELAAFADLAHNVKVFLLPDGYLSSALGCGGEHGPQLHCFFTSSFPRIEILKSRYEVKYSEDSTISDWTTAVKVHKRLNVPRLKRACAVATAVHTQACLSATKLIDDLEEQVAQQDKRTIDIARRLFKPKTEHAAQRLPSTDGSAVRDMRFVQKSGTSDKVFGGDRAYDQKKVTPALLLARRTVSASHPLPSALSNLVVHSKIPGTQPGIVGTKESKVQLGKPTQTLQGSAQLPPGASQAACARPRVTQPSLGGSKTVSPKSAPAPACSNCPVASSSPPPVHRKVLPLPTVSSSSSDDEDMDEDLPDDVMLSIVRNAPRSHRKV